MSRNGSCNKYLSPQQAAVAHFNLRTILKSFLTASSSTAALNVNPALDYSVTTNETWQDGDRYFKGNITVKANKALIIKCGVAMAAEAKIIVEPGGLLTIDGGTITNISGKLWEGISLQGNPHAPQLTPNPNNPGGVLHQGMLRIKNGGTISQANCGVKNYYLNLAYGGGVIFAQNANFLNNLTDVYMDDRHTAGSLPVPSVSWFYNCNFKTTDTIANGLSPQQHVRIARVSGVKFRACTFKCELSPISYPGKGIYGVDAIFSVDQDLTNPCVFENLDRGIYINSTNPLKTPTILNSKFKGNNYGVYAMNANNLALQTNTFTTGNYGIVSHVYLNNCKYYKIKNNEFSSNPSYAPGGEGISVFRSKTGAHEIYRNTFSNLTMAINCMDDNGNPNNVNDGLKMNCNDFHITPNVYDVVLSYSAGLALPLVNKTQGLITSNPPATALVRNIYGANCGNQNKWQIYSGSTVTINHGSNTNSLTAVTQPTTTGCKSSYLNVVDKAVPLDYAADCSPLTPSSGGTSTISSSRLGSMNDYLNDLTADPSFISDNHFEIQSTVASKLNLFLNDSASANNDSIISILENNQGYMEDADIQTVFAYMNKGDYAGAEEKIEGLERHRADWATLLTILLTIELDTTNRIYILGEYGDVLRNYAATENKDGQALAQALLKAHYNLDYTEPHALPEGAGATEARISNQGRETVENKQVGSPTVLIYPNPAHTGVNILYNSSVDGSVKIELRDLSGRVIYTNFITERMQNQYIPMEQISSGMYLVTLTKGKDLIHKEKLIKQ